MVKMKIVEYLGNCDPQNTQILNSDVLDWMNKFLSEKNTLVDKGNKLNKRPWNFIFNMGPSDSCVF